MDLQEARTRLQLHIDSDPYGGGPSTYWPAEEALDSYAEELPQELVTAYYSKIQSVWPEVPPKLDTRPEQVCLAWLEAAKMRDDIRWNKILVEYGRGEGVRVARGFELLHKAWSSPSSPHEEPAVKEASADPDLVQAIEGHLAGNWGTPLPVGWFAILLLAGRAEVAEWFRLYVRPQTEGLLNESVTDEIVRLVGSHQLGPSGLELMAEIDRLRKLRNGRIGQDELFHLFGLNPAPESFHLNLSLQAKSGHRMRFLVQRSWRSTAVWWDFSVGKSSPSFQANPNGVMVNSLKLEKLEFSALKPWLRAFAKRVKTKWVGPLEVEVEGLPEPVRSTVIEFFQEFEA